MDELTQLKNKIQELETKLTNHIHNGIDGSAPLNSNIEVDETYYIRSGSIAMQGKNVLPENRLEGGIVVGDDKVMSDGSKNSQINIQHQTNSDQTFMFGIRSPMYNSNTGSVTSGGTTMSQTSFSWATNELAGAYVAVYDSPTVFNVYPIASNTSSTITITGGTWTFSESGANFFVYMPIYFGSAEYPWRRLYTLDGTGGGIRFGIGQTNAGQQDNGLLYSDSAGDLYWRNYAGSATKLN